MKLAWAYRCLLGVEDVHKWVLQYSQEVFAELCKFADHKLLTDRDKESFKQFLRWYMEPSSDETPVPEGPSVG